MSLMSQKQLEAAAKQLCLLRHVNPDDLHTREGLTRPHWRWAAAEIQDLQLIAHAIDYRLSLPL